MSFQVSVTGHVIGDASGGDRDEIAAMEAEIAAEAKKFSESVKRIGGDKVTNLSAIGTFSTIGRHNFLEEQ